MVKVLEDLQSAWRWGRAPNLLAAMELVMWTLTVQRPDKVRRSAHGSVLCIVLCDFVHYATKKCVRLPLAGQFATAMAPVEATNAEDWSVHPIAGTSWVVFFLSGLPYDCVISPAGAISYVPQLGKWNSLLPLTL